MSVICLESCDYTHVLCEHEYRCWFIGILSLFLSRLCSNTCLVHILSTDRPTEQARTYSHACYTTHSILVFFFLVRLRDRVRLLVILLSPARIRRAHG